MTVGEIPSSVVVKDAHDSAHLALIQCFTDSCGTAVETSCRASWVSELLDLRPFGFG